MTSLAAQLKQLAVPEGQGLLESRLDQASILYPAGEAATYDRQHFYNIGINGLQQLIEKDACFAEFENSLFAPSSQSLQRTMMTSEVNEKLDASIESFLLRLSPYMQLREAHKALEWMVNRYNVHLRNVDTLMMAVLPHHDQPLFVRVLRLIKLETKEARSWQWLQPVQKGEIGLPRATLVTHARTARGFLGLLCDMLTRHLEANTDEASDSVSARRVTRVLGVFTQVVLGVLLTGPPGEERVATLLPTVGAGLRSGLPDFVASSYMILSQLMAQATLEPKLLTSLLNVICKNLSSSHNAVSGISVVVLMYQTQSITELTKKALKYLLAHAPLVATLARLSCEVDVNPFMAALLARLTPRALSSSFGGGLTSDSGSDVESAPTNVPLNTLIELMTSVKMSDATNSLLIRAIVSWFDKQSSKGADIETDSNFNDAFRVFKLLETRFSTNLESFVKDISSNKYKSTTTKLYRRSASSAREGLTTDPSATLTLCLHHHDLEVRKAAAARLMEAQDQFDSAAGLVEAVALRLQEDRSEVVSVLLQNSQKLWSLFDDKKMLEDILYKKLKTCSSKKEADKKLKSQLLGMLCASPDPAALDSSRLTSLLLCQFATCDPLDVSIAADVMNSSFAAFSPIFNKYMQSEWLSAFSKLKDIEKSLDSMKTAAACQNAASALVEAVTCFIMQGCLDPSAWLEAVFSSCALSQGEGCTAGQALLLQAGAGAVQRGGEDDPLLGGGLRATLVGLVRHVAMEKPVVQLNPAKAAMEDAGLGLAGLCASHARHGRLLPRRLLSHALQALTPLPPPAALADQAYWVPSPGPNAEWLSGLTATFTLLLELASLPKCRGKELAQPTLQALVKALGKPSCLVAFLCSLWQGSEVNNKHRALVLQFSLVYLAALPAAQRSCITAQPVPVLPGLLQLLHSPAESVRQLAFQLVEALKANIKDSTGVFPWLAAQLLRYRQEVTNDADFLPQVLRTVLEPDAAPPSPKKRRRASSAPPPHAAVLAFLATQLCQSGNPVKVKADLLAATRLLDSQESFSPLPALLKELITPIKQELEEVASSVTGEEPMDTSGEVSDAPKAAQSAPETLGTHEARMVELVLGRYSATVAVTLTTDAIGLEALQMAMASTLMLPGGETVQRVALKKLSTRFLAALPLACQGYLFCSLVDAAASKDPQAQKRAKKLVKKMSLDSSIVIDEIKKVTDKGTAKTVRESKQQKRLRPEEGPEDDPLATPPWQRLTCLLEMVQSKKKLVEAVKTIPTLFLLLERVLQLEKAGSGEYLKQLILGCLLHICTKAEEGQVSGHDLKVELVVACVRGSEAPHTHQQALLLLSQAAHIAPTELLHNMMSVFTFMGASILRQDDAYSQHVVSRTLASVLPALKLACEEKSKAKTPKKGGRKSSAGVQVASMMTVVLRVFVEALPHMPAHRRLATLSQLVAAVGPDQALWRTIMLIMQRVTVSPVKSALQAPGEDGEELPIEDLEEKSLGPVAMGDLEFLISLCEEFPATLLLSSFTHMLNYLADLPQDKPGSQVVPRAPLADLAQPGEEDAAVFSVAQHSAKQLRHFKFATVFGLRELLASQALLAQISSLEDLADFLPAFQDLLEATLTLTAMVTRSHDQQIGQTGAARFWRILLHKCHDLLDTLVTLLPDAEFLSVVTSLTKHDLYLVRRRALDLLNNKLTYFKDNNEDLQLELLLSAGDQLEAAVARCLLEGQGDAPTPSQEQQVEGQAALYGLKLLARVLGPPHHGRLGQTLSLTQRVLALHNGVPGVAASAVLCVGECVWACRAHCLAQLPGLLPPMACLLAHPEILAQEVLLLAAVSSLQKVIQALPLFLSPYLLDITVKICTISGQLEANAASHKPILLQKVKQICTTIATVTPTRTFLPVLQKSFIALDDKMALCAGCCMGLLREHVAQMGRDELGSFSQDLLSFFLLCLDLRITHPQIEGEDLDKIEDCVIDAFVSLVFKLSESQFKPMLIQLYGWATGESSPVLRVLVFYRLTARLAQRLRNLFTLFAGHILQHAAHTLDLNNKSKQKVTYFGKGKTARAKSSKLVCYVTDTLTLTFSHDTEGFLTRDRFDTVMQPLVDQLENQLGSSSAAALRATGAVVPCLGALAGAAPDDSAWKDLNNQILLKTRHEDKQVRLWGLAAVDAFHKKLGEDFTQLLPETIPFLAELMEDESDEVEKETQKVLAAMETSVGENLQEYF